MAGNKDDDAYPSEEAARRRDEVIRRMANTPPQHRVSRPSPRPKKAAKAASGRGRKKSVPNEKS